jgi:hypothetical protein
MFGARDSSCVVARTWRFVGPLAVEMGSVRWVAGEMRARTTCGLEVLVMTGVACAGSETWAAVAVLRTSGSDGEVSQILRAALRAAGRCEESSQQGQGQ